MSDKTSKTMLDENFEKGLIITDNISRKPILDFEAYQSALIKIITNSFPNFTIGIYGDWGTGKTTLMNFIKQGLNDDIVKNVWFDAWKYENEDEFALIPLLKNINFALKDDEEYSKLKEALKEASIFTLGISQDIISSTVTNYAGDKLGGLVKRSLKSITTDLIPKLRQLNEVDENSIFYNGINKIQKEIDELRIKNPNFRFVIFIDDLDRCSPTKVIQILESIKIFLSLNGIIYVLGLSHNTVIKLIEEKYKINGEKYLQKFIQIPITLTEWNKDDIEKLIDHLLKENIIATEYKQIIEGNISIITSTLEENPREVKRFLNNLIISYEVFVGIKKIEKEEDKKKFLKQLLLIQIINSNWKEIYKYIVNSNGKIIENLSVYKPITTKKIDDLSKDQILESDTKKIFDKYKTDSKLWVFLNKYLEVLNDIKDYDIFRRAVKLTEDQPVSVNDINKEVIDLLKLGKINEFNAKRITKFKILNLKGISLSGAKLSGADLSGADLSGTRLLEADLSGADLSGAKLSGAKLLEADLSGAKLLEADLSGADLSEVNLFDADLSGADLSGARLLETKLRMTILSKTDMSKAKLLEADLSGADLSEANLADVDLSNTNLKWANLQQANLSRANLSGAKLLEANLSGADLSEVNLSGANCIRSIIIKPQNYESITLNEKTNFKNAICDHLDFIDYISKHTENIPDIVNNKKELKLKLEEKKMDEYPIVVLLEFSKLPD